MAAEQLAEQSLLCAAPSLRAPVKRRLLTYGHRVHKHKTSCSTSGQLLFFFFLSAEVIKLEKVAAEAFFLLFTTVLCRPAHNRGVLHHIVRRDTPDVEKKTLFNGEKLEI